MSSLGKITNSWIRDCPEGLFRLGCPSSVFIFVILDFVYTKWYSRLWFTKKRSGGAVQWFWTSESFDCIFGEFSKDGARTGRNPGPTNKKLIFPKTWTLTFRECREQNFISVYHVISLVKSGGAVFQVQHCDSMVPLVVLKARLVSVWVKDESCYSRLISSICYNCNQFSYLISYSWMTGPKWTGSGPRTGQPWSFSW